jgi:hypothetical protein
MLPANTPLHPPYAHHPQQIWAPTTQEQGLPRPPNQEQTSGGTAPAFLSTDRSAQGRMQYQQRHAGGLVEVPQPHPTTSAHALESALRGQTSFQEEPFHRLAQYLGAEPKLATAPSHNPFATVHQALGVFVNKAISKLELGALRENIYVQHRLELLVTLVCQEFFSYPHTLGIMGFDDIKQIALLHVCADVGIDLSRNEPEQRAAKRLTPERYKELGWQCVSYGQCMPLWGQMSHVFDAHGFETALQNHFFDVLEQLAAYHHRGSLTEHVPGAAMVQLVAHAYPSGQLAHAYISPIVHHAFSHDSSLQTDANTVLVHLGAALNRQHLSTHATQAQRVQASRPHQLQRPTALIPAPQAAPQPSPQRTPQPPQLPTPHPQGAKRARLETRQPVSQVRSRPNSMAVSASRVTPTGASTASHPTSSPVQPLPPDLRRPIRISLHHPTLEEFVASLCNQPDIESSLAGLSQAIAAQHSSAPYCKKTYEAADTASHRVITYMGENVIRTGGYTTQCFQIYTHLLFQHLNHAPEDLLNCCFNAVKSIVLAYASCVFGWENIDTTHPCHADMVLAKTLNQSCSRMQKRRLAAFKGNMTLLSGILKTHEKNGLVHAKVQQNHFNTLISLAEEYQKSKGRRGNLSAIDQLVSDARENGVFSKKIACLKVRHLLSEPRNRKYYVAVFSDLESALGRETGLQPGYSTQALPSASGTGDDDAAKTIQAVQAVQAVQAQHATAPETRRHAEVGNFAATTGEWADDDAWLDAR